MWNNPILPVCFPAGPHLGPSVVSWRAGSCREFADLVVYVMRALGIPLRDRPYGDEIEIITCRISGIFSGMAKEWKKIRNFPYWKRCGIYN